MATEWVEQYTKDVTRDSERIVLTHNELGIEGLLCFGYTRSHLAKPGLITHFHKNCIEITYVANGSISFDIQARDYKLYAGDVFIVRENTPHSNGSIPRGISELYWLQISIEDSPDYLLLSSKGKVVFMEHLMGLCNGSIKIGITLGQMFQKAFSMMTNGNNAQKNSAVSLIIHLVYTLTEYQSIASHSELTEDIGQAIDYIMEHIEGKIDLEELSQNCYLSLSRFTKKFKDQTGLSPRDFINIQKIEKAKKMLKDGISVTETALRLDFSTSSYFSYVFKRYTALSPISYIRINKN